MKKTSSLVIAALGMLLGSYAKAQLDVPVSHVSLEFPGGPQVQLHIGATNETVISTPFLIQGLEASSHSWLCMDPLQRIYYNNSGLPAGTNIHYASNNPADFDIWNPGSPGLTTSRIQDLADLFTAYWPPVDNSLINGALQLAVWEVTNEYGANPYDLTTGAFTGSNNPTLIALAQSMLNSLGTAAVHNHGNVGSLTFLIDGTTTINGDLTLVQDLVGWNPREFIPVPEPSTYGLGAILGLGLITAIRRRRARVIA